MKLRLKLLALAALVTAVAAPVHAADTYEIDAAHSFVVFKLKHMNTSWAYGTFGKMSGTATFDEADPTKSSINLTIDPTSIDTGIEKRDGHLKSPDFFNVKEFPEITFKSTGVTKTADGKGQVTGELTLLGKTVPVTATIEETGSGKGMNGEDRRGAQAEFSFKRSDFGMNWGIDNGVLADETFVTVSLAGIKK